MCECALSHVQLFVTPWTVARQIPLFMEFSRQEYWSGLPFPSPGDLPNSGWNPRLLRLLHWQYSLPAEPPKKPSAVDIISISNGGADFCLYPSSHKEALTPPLKTWIQVLLKIVSSNFEQCLIIDFN